MRYDTIKTSDEYTARDQTSTDTHDLKVMLDYLRVDAAGRPREENNVLARLQVIF